MKYPSSLSFLLLLSATSSHLVQSKSVHPKDVHPDDTYVLTLEKDPKRALDSTHAILDVKSFGSHESPEDASDNGKRWTFPGRIPEQNGTEWDKGFLLSKGGGGNGGWVSLRDKEDGKLSTDGKDDTVKAIVIRDGDGVKIRSNDILWVDENGRETFDAAKFCITKTTPFKKGD